VNQHHTIRLSSWVRLVGLALLLGVGLLASLGLASGTVHAATTLTVTNCSNDSQLQADVRTANSDNDNDTITFTCNGAIPLTSTLTIAGSMTLDGSGQTISFDGQHLRRVLFVNGGVTLTLKALTIANGSVSGDAGGGIFNNGTLSISTSTVSGNFASGGGGGLENHGMVSISTSTVSGNSAGCCGGGAGGGGMENAGTASISNSTFSGNSVNYGGGGMVNAGTLSISTSTVSGNSASRFGGGLWIPGCPPPSNCGTVSISGSIVANNGGGNCFGGVSDQGYNLESGTDCGFTGTGSLQNTDPKLDPGGLQNNGGPTQTIALLDGSPAINKIPASACTVTTDQRGISRPQGPACDIGAFEFRVPKLSLPGTITTDATSSQGATVTYTATASLPDDASATPSVSCSPASGSTFAIGTTTVNCTASDAATPPDVTTGSFSVTVNDTDLGLTNMPANMPVNATSPQGATVTYTPPTVVDEDSPLPPVNCTPASGSTFAIGTTTVTCTVSDSGDTPSSVSQSFTVMVNGAATQVSDLITTVDSFGLPADIQAGFDTQLQAVQTDLTNNNPAQACRDLTAFINHVQAQSGKHLTVSQADKLLAAAKQVQAVLGC
jgi:hypothetical protein